MSERKSGELSRKADASKTEAVGRWDTCSQLCRRVEALATLVGICNMYRAASSGLLSRKMLLQMELEQLSSSKRSYVQSKRARFMALEPRSIRKNTRIEEVARSRV